MTCYVPLKALRNSSAYSLRTNRSAKSKTDNPFICGGHHKGETFDGYLVMDDKLTRGLAYTDKARASGSDTHATHGLGFNREGIQCVRSCNGGEVTDRPQDPTYGKRSRQIPDIKKIGAIRESPKKFAAGQGAGTGRNSRYQKIEGTRIVRVPFHPYAKIRPGTIAGKAIRAPYGRPCQLSHRAFCWSLPGESGGSCAPADTARKRSPTRKKTVARLLFSCYLTIFTLVI